MLCNVQIGISSDKIQTILSVTMYLLEGYDSLSISKIHKAIADIRMNKPDSAIVVLLVVLH